MASLKIEGFTQGINNARMDFIRGVVQRRGFTNNKVIIEPVGKVGDNYMATVIRIRIVQENGKEFKMVAKFAPEEQVARTAANAALMFNNEIFMYEKILPKMLNLQKAAGVPKENWFRFPECYGTLSEEPHETIVFEDLGEYNFTLLDRFTSLSDEAVRLIFKNFAIFHSLSFVLKKVESETYNSYVKELRDLWSILFSLEPFKIVFAQLEEQVTEMVDGKYKNAFKGLAAQMPEIAMKLKKAAINSKNLVIQHGDAWTNNMLFKLEGDSLKECIMIDYQAVRESNPVSDILNLVFICTDHATREKHYLDWIDYYHRQLDESLSYFGMKASFVYPKDQLDADLKRHSKLAFGMSVMFLSILTRNQEEAKEAQEAMRNNSSELSTNTLSRETIVLYKSRLEDLAESFRLFGYM